MFVKTFGKPVSEKNVYGLADESDPQWFQTYNEAANKGRDCGTPS